MLSIKRQASLVVHDLIHDVNQKVNKPGGPGLMCGVNQKAEQPG